ncbi:hypothetical protein [Pseudomonas sp. S2_A02]|jgi:hypothetical protein
MIFKPFIFFFGMLCCISVFAQECVEVRYIPFDRELYGPESEKTIAHRAHKQGFISVAGIKSLLTSEQVAKIEYEPNNTRVEISYLGRPIFIDRDGVVRYGEKYYMISISEFEDMIVASCKE